MEQLKYKKVSVNIYDLFANFLPGFILIGGVLLPFLAGNGSSNISISEGAFVTLAAFAIGGGTQALGSHTKRYRFRFPFLSFPADSEADTGTSCTRLEEILQWLHLDSYIEKRKLPFNSKLEEIDQKSQDVHCDLSFSRKPFFPSMQTDIWNRRW